MARSDHKPRRSGWVDPAEIRASWQNSDIDGIEWDDLPIETQTILKAVMGGKYLPSDQEWSR